MDQNRHHPQPDGALTLDYASATTGSDPAAATTIISFVLDVKIAFIELYYSGLTKKQTFQWMPWNSRHKASPGSTPVSNH